MYSMYCTHVYVRVDITYLYHIIQVNKYEYIFFKYYCGALAISSAQYLAF